jgi:sec-independent protein translocase protein TatA
MGISGSEIFVILLFVLIFFGADKIPELARSLGKGLREFKKATDDIKSEIHKSTSDITNDIENIGKDIKKDLHGKDIE